MSDDKQGVTATEVFVNDEDRLDKYKLDIINDADQMSDQRDKANLDFRFINVPGGMWEDWNETAFVDRVRLEFDETSPFKNRFMGEWGQNRMGVEYKPDDLKTSDADAELLNGLFRANFRDENGKISLDNAVDETSICGYGCLKLATRFNDDEDPENDDQVAEFRPIYNAYNMVYWDRAAQWINKKDARRCTVLEPYTPDSFKEVYGEDADAVSAYTPHTRSFSDFTLRTKTVIFIATRYEIIRKKTKFHIYSNLKTNEIESYTDEDLELIEKELKADPNRKLIRTRIMIKQTVEKSTFSGEKFLKKPKKIPGKYIPIIPFYGYRSYVDGIERYHGLVRKLMDPQRLLNMQMSRLAEDSATSGGDMPIFDPDQMPDNLANLWANPINKPYMLAKSLVDDKTGEIIQAGPLGFVKAKQLDGSTAALLEIVPRHIQQVTGGAPQDTIDPDASGKAIIALQKRENMKTATIMDNIKSSIEWMGEVYQSIASEIYNSRRIVRLIGEDGTQRQTTMFNEIMDEKTGIIVLGNNLLGKKFKAYADAGPQYETMREQTVEDIKGMMDLLIKAGPTGEKYIPVLTAMMLEDMNGVGLKDFKAVVRKDLIMQGVKEPETDEEKAMVQQAQAQSQQPSKQDQLMEAAANQANSEGEKFKSDARLSDAKAIDTVASARKKAAETRKILSEIGLTGPGMLKEILSASLRRAEKLPFPQIQGGQQ